MYTLTELLWARLPEWAELVTSQLSERGIVATVFFLFLFFLNKLALRRKRN
jgi:hypothetical protein